MSQKQVSADDLVKNIEKNLDISKKIIVSEVDDGQACLVCEDKCPGFASHPWRNTCINCHCLRQKHNVYNDNFVNILDRLGWKNDVERSDNEKMLREGFSWVPSHLNREQILDYMEQLPNDKAPRVGTVGEQYRNLQIICQLPKQDLSDVYCEMLQCRNDLTEFRLFCELRDQVAMGVGKVIESSEDAICDTCNGEIEKAELLVVADKAVGGGKIWHPACFLCCVCDELLVDLVYCYHAQCLYCERHYAQLLRPRCPACDELIFSSEYIKAMEENYHQEHLACWNCDKTLKCCRYITREEHPHCLPCFQELFSNTCEKCSERIGPDFRDLSYKDRHWHDFCFKCAQCEKSLVDQPFVPKDTKMLCSDCFDNNFATRCDGCGNPFKGGMKKFEYKGNQWHSECFLCSECNQPIGNGSFYPRDERIICHSCYESKFAKKCSKCSGVIDKGGISYKDSPWHRECFTCTKCSKQLAEITFTSKDDLPYCGDCFGELFAKRCCRCSGPITCIGETKYISFDERHWHSDCFVCYKCNASMLGRGFLMDGEAVVCPDCGRSS